MTILEQPDINEEETQHLANYDVTKTQHSILNQFYRAQMNDTRRHKDGEIDHGGWRLLSDFQHRPQWAEVVILIEMGLLEWAGFIRISDEGAKVAYSPWREYARCTRITSILEQAFPDTVFSVWAGSHNFMIDYDEQAENAPRHSQIYAVLEKLSIPREHLYLNIPF